MSIGGAKRMSSGRNKKDNFPTHSSIYFRKNQTRDHHSRLTCINGFFAVSLANISSSQNMIISGGLYVRACV